MFKKMSAKRSVVSVIGDYWRQCWILSNTHFTPTQIITYLTCIIALFLAILFPIFVIYCKCFIYKTLLRSVTSQWSSYSIPLRADLDSKRCQYHSHVHSGMTGHRDPDTTEPEIQSQETTARQMKCDSHRLRTLGTQQVDTPQGKLEDRVIKLLGKGKISNQQEHPSSHWITQGRAR
jgi:hypothetical protein